MVLNIPGGEEVLNPPQWLELFVSDAGIIGVLDAQLYVEDENGTTGDEFLGEVCRRLQESLTRAHEANAARLGAELEQAEENLNSAEENYRRLRVQMNAILEQSQMPDLSREFVVDLVSGLQEQMRDMEMGLASLRVRRDAIEEGIGRTGALIRQRIAEDIICSELEEFAALYQARYETVANYGNDSSQLEATVLEYRMELTDARIAVAERQEAVRQQNGGAQLDAWTNEISELAIEIATIEGSRRFTQNQLERASNIQPLAEQFAECQRELNMAVRPFNQALQEVEAARAHMRYLAAPEVVILSGD